jgi:hypothetical protein
MVVMMTRRSVVLSLALMTGCASQASKPSASSAHLRKPAAQPATWPDEPKWEAATPPTAPDLLTKKATDFAKSMQAADTETPTTPPAATDEGSTALLGEGRNHRKGKQQPSAVVDPPVIPDRPLAAVPAPTEVIHHPAAPMPGDPQIVPESADFQYSANKPNNLDALGDRLHKRLVQNPRDIANQFDMDLYGILNDDPGAELASVSAMSDDDAELVSTLVDGLTLFRSVIRQDGNLLATQKMKPLLEMADRLRAQADLTVPTVELCSRVEAYGKYTPISPARFPAGRDNPAIVYCEVENFLPKQNPQGNWQTKLTEQVMLFTDQGMLVWSDTERQVTDECRRRRHDFFAYNVIHLPANLPMGRYNLKVSIEDKNANHVAESSVPLKIVAQ